MMPKQLGDGREGCTRRFHPAIGSSWWAERLGLMGFMVRHSPVWHSTKMLRRQQHKSAMRSPKNERWIFCRGQRFGLFTCVTDNGAGGLSSSGEMATLSNGASLDLALAPTKYPNLKPWELMISESQERMTFAVAPADIDAFLDLASRRGVVATDIGSFTDSGLLEVLYNGTYVGCLDLDFLHESLSQMQLKARWEGQLIVSWIDKDLRADPTSLSWSEKLKRLLSTPNVVSKEPWVRQYDHEVQGATVVKPFGGDSQQGPNDSGVLWLHPHGGAQDNAVSVGCGLAPRLSLYDPYT